MLIGHSSNIDLLRNKFLGQRGGPNSRISVYHMDIMVCVRALFPA